MLHCIIIRSSVFILILHLSETVFADPEVLSPQNDVVVVEVGKHGFSEFTYLIM